MLRSVGHIANWRPDRHGHSGLRCNNAKLCPQHALVLDPKFTKAHCRHGLVRKGNFEFAWAAVGELLLCSTPPVR